jgi:hypothetical protein
LLQVLSASPITEASVPAVITTSNNASANVRSGMYDGFFPGFASALINWWL